MRRTPGGAVYVNNNNIENNTKIKSQIETFAKQYIAKLASDFITDYKTIFLDSSSTAYILAELLVDSKNLTVITTNTETAILLSVNSSIKTYIVGGLVKDDIVQGNYPINIIDSIHADIAFLSCKAFDNSFGCYEIIESEVIIKRKMQQNSTQAILLIDNTKFNQKATYKSLTIVKFDYIITDNNNKITISTLSENFGIDIIN